MKVFAIGDLHLSFAKEKPMDLFGNNWADHPERIRSAWTKLVGDEDLVLIPGDISWAMRLEDALPDLSFIDSLPGQKLLLRGNHDYWWSSPTKIRSVLPSSVRILQNESFRAGTISISGTRLWTAPGSKGFGEDDEKIYARELGRLKLSLDAAGNDGRKLVMTHYPPFSDKSGPTPVTEMLEAYGVSVCVYGHLHGAAHRLAFEGEKNGVLYRLVSSDYLGFSPAEILDLPGIRI